MTQDETNTESDLTPASKGRQFGVWVIEFYLLGLSIIALIVLLNRMPQSVWEFYLYFIATGALVIGLPSFLLKGETLGTLLVGCRSYAGQKRVSPFRQFARSLLLSINLVISFYSVLYGAFFKKDWPYDPILRIRLNMK